MPDVILPVLNERDALPWVLERMPEGYAPIVVDNGSTDGSGDDRIGARDGRADEIDCGTGEDRVTADRRDEVAPNCETVERR